MNGSPRFSLRTQLGLVALTLLVIPWLGYQSVRSLEQFLRQSAESALVARTRIIAELLSGHPALASIKTASDQQDVRQEAVFLRKLETPIELDGYTDDWLPYTSRYVQYQNTVENRANATQVQFQLGWRNTALYAVFRITDKQILYQSPKQNGSLSDHLLLSLVTPQGEFRQYRIATSAPGKVIARRLQKDTTTGINVAQADFQIQGVWQESENGYTIELRLPAYLVGDKLGFQIVNVDKRQSGEPPVITKTGNADTGQPASLARIIHPDPVLETLLASITESRTRTWITDKRGNVQAVAGKLFQGTAKPEQRSWASQFIHGLYRMMLEGLPGVVTDQRIAASTLKGPEIRQALAGQAASGWQSSDDKRRAILSAASPIRDKQRVYGAVVMEQTSRRILLLQNRVLANVINTSLTGLLVVLIVLLAYATRLSYRIRRLRSEADQAIDQNGRIHKRINASSANDEIGDLSRSFAHVVKRLDQHTSYLESLSGKLAHELRTPLTIVRSSLDNLDGAQQSEATLTWLIRAREGVDRLGGLLTRMSEAARLEQSLQGQQKRQLELNGFIKQCCDAYQQANTGIIFVMKPCTDKAMVMANPELLSQCLDKLISNAMDFSRADTPIVLSLHCDASVVKLEISNQGPTLPESIRDNLFESMVSQREKQTAGEKQPAKHGHLGLGLYIVRLITEFHDGQVKAENLPDLSGVCISITLPANRHPEA